MKKVSILMVLIVFLFITLFITNTNAAGSVSLSSSSSTLNPGDEFTISANLSGASIAALTLRISIDTSKVEYVSGPSNTNYSNGKVIYTWVDPSGGNSPKTSGTIATFKFRAKAVGKATFSASGDFYTPEETNANPSFSGTNVTIEEKVTSTPNTNTTGNTSSNTSNGGTTAGNTNSSNSGGSTNTSSGTSSTSKNTNANLKSLQLNVEGISPKFSKSTTNYFIVVSDTVDSIQVTAIPEDSSAKVSISGNTSLSIGSNKINIVVTAADNKTQKNYIINVTKTSNPGEANANLENLAIENFMLSPEFSADVLDYTIEIPSTTDLLNILAIPQIQEATVLISGHEALQFGENVITVTVTAKDGITSKVYTINGYKKTIEEEQTNAEHVNEEVEVIEANKIGTGQIVFSSILGTGTVGAIFILIRRYMLENRV